MIGLIVCLTAGSANGQIFSTVDTLGFGYKTQDTLRALPDSFIDIPVFLSTDSIVTGLSMLFEFDTAVFWPQIAFDQGYQNLIDAGGFVPDSNDYQASPVMDSGLWNVQMYMKPSVAQTWNDEWGTAQVLYNLNDRGHARLLLTPKTPPFEGDPNYDKPFIEGKLGGDGGGGVIAYIKFAVNPEADTGWISHLKLELQNEDLQKTELAQEWDSTGLVITKAIIPTFDTALFITEPPCDTCPDDPEDTLKNDLPLLFVGGNAAYNINPGQQVTFTVTATDAEEGEVRILCNGGSLPPNATFGTSGLVVGGGGLASGNFSFVPDVSQQGAFIFTFVATDDSSASSTPSSVSVTVSRPDVDILYTSSAEGLSPVGGVPGLHEVMVPINVVTNNVIYGIQFDLEYDANAFDLDSVITSDRVADWVIYDDVGINPGLVKVVAFGLASDSMVPGTTSAALFLAFSVDEFAEIGAYPLDIYNAWESIDPDPGVPSLELETDSGIIYVDQWGDVNLDQRIDVADLVSTVAYIINTYDLNRRQFATADIVIDATVNVVDLVGIINTIFGLPVSPSPAPELLDEFATLNVTHDEIPGAGIESEMKVLADMPMEAAGVELEIQYNPQTVEMLTPILTDESRDFRISSSDNGSGQMKVVIYSDHPWNDQELIPQGLSDILKLPFISRGVIAEGDNRQVRITRAYVSSGAAMNIPVKSATEPLPNTFELYQNRPNPFNPITTIDFYIDGSDFGSEEVTLEVFNILGQKIKILLDENLAPGQYSVVWDGTDEYGEHSASGIYLYRLRVGDADRTKKMMLLK
jgi:hypothetical protein